MRLVAVGLDYLRAAPVRGTRYGGGGETLKWRCTSIRRASRRNHDQNITLPDLGSPRYKLAAMSRTKTRKNYREKDGTHDILLRSSGARRLVMIADTRTNAGLDVSTFRKLHVYTEPGERIMAIASSGNCCSARRCARC